MKGSGVVAEERTSEDTAQVLKNKIHSLYLQAVFINK